MVLMRSFICEISFLCDNFLVRSFFCEIKRDNFLWRSFLGRIILCQDHFFGDNFFSELFFGAIIFWLSNSSKIVFWREYFWQDHSIFQLTHFFHHLKLNVRFTYFLHHLGPKFLTQKFTWREKIHRLWLFRGWQLNHLYRKTFSYFFVQIPTNVKSQLTGIFINNNILTDPCAIQTAGGRNVGIKIHVAPTKPVFNHNFYIFVYICV